METPLYPQALIGYRQWWVDQENRLMPFASAGPPWVPGVNYAYCYDQEELERTWPLFEDYHQPTVAAIRHHHQAPESQCQCGFYAWNEPSFKDYDCHTLTTSSGRLHLNGSIAAKGKVEIHENGFRAQETQIIALYLEEAQQEDPEQKDRAKQIASAYKVPLHLNYQQWLAFSKNQGEGD